MEAISFITEVQRRRRFLIADKLRAVRESSEPGMSVSYVARKYGISSSLLFTWRRRMAEGGKQAIQADDDVIAASGVRELKRRIWELERVLGKKTLDVKEQYERQLKELQEAHGEAMLELRARKKLATLLLGGDEK